MAIDQKELGQAMESCADAGMARSIGVSSWSIESLEELLGLAGIAPAVNQVEVHPVWRQEKLRELLKQKGIVITAYYPRGAPNSVYSTNDVITDSAINETAAGINKTPAQVILRWLYERGVSFIIRSYNRKRLEEGFNFLDCTLSAEHCRAEESCAWAMDHTTPVQMCTGFVG